MHLTTPHPGFPKEGDQPIPENLPGPSPEFIAAQAHMQNVPDGHIPWEVTATRKLDEEQWSL